MGPGARPLRGLGRDDRPERQRRAGTPSSRCRPGRAKQPLGCAREPGPMKPAKKT